ncbi:MAG TPA: M1 family metallopeptidase [Longimicrobiales bacterium]|nr:M1 family metallopeptidase [Longimicrobiales bacterium]
MGPRPRPRPILATLLALCAAACASARPAPVAPAPRVPAPLATPERPRPYPVFETPGFRRAVERGTRTRTGRPGPRYWQQYARYRITAELDPATARLSGAETVRYLNRSPDTLATLSIHLYQNANAPTAMRDRFVPATGGVALTRVAAQGQEIPARAAPGRPYYLVTGTVASIRLPHPLAPGDSAELELAWSFTVPPVGNPRMGTDGEVFFLGYWYPQLAVYDDVNGWQADQYMTNAEFYMGYADYDVSLTVPAGFLVAATGTLRNPADVLSPRTRQRIASPPAAGGLVRVVAPAERGAGRATAGAPGGKLTWRWTASNVRDFAWGTSDRYVWDAAAVEVPDAHGDGRPDTVVVNAFYRPEKGTSWNRWASLGARAVAFFSRELWPYPWPHMDLVEGILDGGMEYPMATLIGGTRDSTSLYGVSLHEIGHMWFPMMVGSDEKRHSWQDEGVNSYVDDIGLKEARPASDPFGADQDGYLELARVGSADGEWIGGEVELMRHGDLYPPLRPAFGAATYTKTAVVLHMLDGLLGADVLHRALREYGRRWMYRHPDAYDFFNTIDDVAGRDLDWFWRPWFFETWTLDQAIAGVDAAGDSATIHVEDRGLAPMPARIAVTRADGRVDRVEVPVEVWLAGARRHDIRVAAAPAITRVEIDPERFFPDVDRTNQVWTPR